MTFRQYLPLLLLTATAHAQSPVAEASPDVAIAAVKPALVRIIVAEANYTEGREAKQEISGSGVIISADGYVVTNHHVAGNAKRMFCTLADRTQVEADLVGTDPLTDIAVIKLRSTGAANYPAAKWGDSSALKVGETVFAMGSPLSLSQSVTQGIVSNTEMIMPDFASESFTLEGEDVGSMVRWIGHDAQISPGNSGGPLVDPAGEVVGINEISFGLSGAIPSNVAHSVADTIIKSGKVSRAWMGFETQPLLRGSGQTVGVLIGGVLPKSPAGVAGIKPGDVLTKVGATDVSVRFAEQMPIFNQMIAALPIGQPVDITVLRGGVTVPLKIVPEARRETEPKPGESKPWGLVVANVSSMEALERHRPDTMGVLVGSVRPGGPAGTAKPTIMPDDLILELNGHPVKDKADFNAWTDANVPADKTTAPVLVTFEHEGERYVSVVDVGSKEVDDPGREARKAYIAIGTQVLSPEIAKALGSTGKKGFRVTRVDAGTSAAKAGLKVGDLIVAVDKDPLDASQPEDADVLADLIRQYEIGATVQLGVISAGAERQVPVVLDAAPITPREMKRYRDDNFEFTARDVADQDRTTQRIDKDVTGVYVEDVTEGGWAALGHLNVGDVIVSADGQPTHTVDELRDVMHKAAVARAHTVVLHVARGIEEFFVEMETDWPAAKAA